MIAFQCIFFFDENNIFSFFFFLFSFFSSATKNIDFLVDSVEGVIRTERHGWISSSESTKRLKEAMLGLQSKGGSVSAAEVGVTGGHGQEKNGPG